MDDLVSLGAVWSLTYGKRILEDKLDFYESIGCTTLGYSERASRGRKYLPKERRIGQLHYAVGVSG